MDIHSAMMHMHSVKSYIESLNNSDAKVYSKTKKKLTDLSSDMLQCVQMISEILKEESLNTDDTDNLSVAIVNADISKLSTDMQATQNAVDDLEKFARTPETTTIPTDTDSSIMKLDPKRYRKWVVSSYGHTLKKLPDNLNDYPDAMRCARLLWNWYNTRFFCAQNNSFRYNVQHIPIWVRNIVLAYGKNLENGNIDDFCNQFQIWLMNVQVSNSSSSKYAVPYEVHMLDAEITADDVTLTATQLWDIMYDHGLGILSNASMEGAAVTSEFMYNLCTRYKPSIADEYSYYADETKDGTERGEAL